MPYTFDHVPQMSSVDELRAYLESELRKISESFGETDALELRASRHEPQRTREGMIIHADGTAWDPGEGEGTYRYQGGLWIRIPDPTEIPVVAKSVRLIGDTDATLVSDQIVYTNAA